ncbi:MAG TPA: hypothetical protein PK609_01765 [Candidatus Paceibacterota bacterium]|nr:hypothetical protein [Candidatus Paceibacterota bacterium]
MCTLETEHTTKERTTGLVSLPAHPSFDRNGSVHVLIGLVPRSCASAPLITAFLDQHGLRFDGKVEHVRSIEDEWIEFERTVVSTSIHGLRAKAREFKSNLASGFPDLTEINVL